MIRLLTIICLMCSLVSYADQEKKVVLLTGASRGLGAEIAREFQQAGWSVWASCRGEIVDAVEGVHYCTIDVTDKESIDAVIHTIMVTEGRIDALVNNAGYGLVASIESATMQEAKAIFDVNLFGAIQMIQSVAPIMRAQQSGVVVNISSVAGIRSIPALGYYAASKFALEAISESLATELSPWNIHVVLIESGTIKNGWAGRCLMGTKEVDTSFYDKLSQGLYARMCRAAAVGEDPKAISSLILKTVEETPLNLRYQTSPNAKAIAAKRFVDPTGRTLLEDHHLLMQAILAEEPLK